MLEPRGTDDDSSEPLWVTQSDKAGEITPLGESEQDRARPIGRAVLRLDLIEGGEEMLFRSLEFAAERIGVSEVDVPPVARTDRRRIAHLEDVRSFWEEPGVIGGGKVTEDTPKPLGAHPLPVEGGEERRRGDGLRGGIEESPYWPRKLNKPLGRF